MRKRKFRLFLTTSLAVLLLGQTFPVPAAYSAAIEPVLESALPASGSPGKWMTGEYHVHTYESNDAQESLKHVLDTAFEQNGLDWLALADHLRMSDRDDEGTAIPGGPIPLSKGIAAYQTPVIQKLQAEGKYAGKIIFSGFEWDMPQYDHASVGIVTDEPGSDEALKAISRFEYLFTNRAANLFDPADVAKWNAEDARAYTSKTDTRTGIQWVSGRYPESYVLINHPSRKNGGSSELKIQDIRDFNNIDPHVVFGFEGMPGNQMAPDRGETVEVFGGTDAMVAKLGGVWDALLGEGRRFWNFANSDFHFKTSKDNKYSSGYWPGEYSKNYTWVEGTDISAVVDGMRSGKSFSVLGDLIDALEFKVSADGRQEEMGGELNVKEGDGLELTIRFKSPESNNNGDAVQVDHVDLISGEVNGKLQPGTAEYNKATNTTTRVEARFTSADWTTDAEGYNVITYKLGAADKDRYFRLRGTNLGVNVPGETSGGEPLLDVKNLTVDNPTRFAEINARNYSDLWFYSNPVFVNVEPYSDKQAVEDTAAALQLKWGDAGGVTSNLQLPAVGVHGAALQWESGDSQLLHIEDGTGYIHRPAAGQLDGAVTLKATVSRGTYSSEQTFEIIIKALDYTDIEAVQLAKEKLTLGPTSSVESNLYLPAAGEQGTTINWTSSNPVLLKADGTIAFQPQRDTVLTLTATISRGAASETKDFEVTLRGDESIIPLELHSTLKTADGQSYLNGAWTGQSVAISVYASVYVPGTTVSMQVSLDGNPGPQSYWSGQPVAITVEGQHQLQFKATDTLGNTASLPLAVNIDRTAPVITLLGKGAVTLTQGEKYTDPGADVIDKTGIAGPIRVTGEVDTATPATYTLRYNASDLAGNAALEAVRTVVVTARAGSGADNSAGNGNNSGGSGSGGNSTTGNNGNVTPPVSAIPGTIVTPGDSDTASAVQLEVDAQQGASGILKGIASFAIPAGELSADSTIALKALTPEETPGTGRLQAVSPAVRLSSTGSGTLINPVELSLSYKADLIASGHKAAVYYFNEQRKSWVYIGGAEHADGTISVNAGRFAEYAVFNYQPLPLTDLGNHWSAAYTDRLIGMEVMQGFEDQSFRPGAAVTRAQFAAMIVRALALPDADSTEGFADQSRIPAWAANEVAAAVQAGIIRGYDEGGQSFFKSSGMITRAEMSVMLANALNTTSYNKQESAELVFTDNTDIPQWAQASVQAGITAGILGGYENDTFRPGQTATRAEAAATLYKLLEALSI